MIIKLIHKQVQWFLDILFPESCFGCGKKSEYLCQKCLSEIRPIAGRQDVPLPVFAASSYYENPLVKKLVWHLKYRDKRGLAEILAEIIMKNIGPKLGGATAKLLIPIPISKKKLKQRGYNQSALIAKILSSKTGIPCREDILYKKFHTLSQVETKTKIQRMENLKGSFEVFFGSSALTWELNSQVLLVDDIITTGATLGEAAKTLKLAGFKKVIGIVVAKG